MDKRLASSPFHLRMNVAVSAIYKIPKEHESPLIPSKIWGLRRRKVSVEILTCRGGGGVVKGGPGPPNIWNNEKKVIFI